MLAYKGLRPRWEERQSNAIRDSFDFRSLLQLDAPPHLSAVEQ